MICYNENKNPGTSQQERSNQNDKLLLAYRKNIRRTVYWEGRRKKIAALCWQRSKKCEGFFSILERQLYLYIVCKSEQGLNINVLLKLSQIRRINTAQKIPLDWIEFIDDSSNRRHM